MSEDQWAHIRANRNTQGEEESVPEHFGLFLISCIKIYRQYGMIRGLDRELLCVEARQKVSSHTSGKKIKSHHVLVNAGMAVPPRSR